MPTEKFPEMPDLFDPVCQRAPEAIPEYTLSVSEGGYLEPGEVASDYVWTEEGTLDKDSGLFLCTECYVNLGQPSSDEGWTATRENLHKLGVRFS